MTSPSQSLISPSQIGSLYSRACADQVNSILQLLACGEALLAHKEGLCHGEWMLWLKTHQWELGFTDRTARRLMMAARKRTLTSNLTLEDATSLSRMIWNNNAVEEDESESTPTFRRLAQVANWVKSHTPKDCAYELTLAEIMQLRPTIEQIRAWLDQLQSTIDRREAAKLRIA